MAKVTETETAEKAHELIKDIEDLIKEKLGDKTFIKKNPFIDASKPIETPILIDSLPLALKNFGKEEEKNWIFYGPPGTGKTFALNKIGKVQIVINGDLDFGLMNFYEIFIKLEWIKEGSERETSYFLKIIHRFLAKPFLNFGIELIIKKHRDPENPDHPTLFKDGTIIYQFLVGKNWTGNQGYTEFGKSDISMPINKERDYGKNELVNINKHYDKFEKELKIVTENICNNNIFQPSVSGKIVFHPSYTYEDFVGGIKPAEIKSSEKSLTYKYTLGVMLDLIRKAWDKEGVRYYLIIDEFNRGNIAAIFGEFLYLIENDKRSEKENSGNDYVFLPGGVYPWDDEKEVPPFSEKCKIRMPRNIFIVGALNTADRSIATMDFAMRRRFNFVKFEPNEELITGFTLEKARPSDDYLKVLFVSLNKSINYKLDADHEIGHYYFMPTPEIVKNSTETFLEDLFERKIIPLLEAYCDHDDQAVKKILILTKLIIENPKKDIKFLFRSINNSDKNIKELYSQLMNDVKLVSNPVSNKAT